MIKFEKVTKKYFKKGSNKKESIALDNVSFEIKRKEFVSIVGKSGAGKTTLLKLLLAQEKPTSGHVFFEDQNVHQLKLNELPDLRKNIGSVFQDYKLLFSKTVYENVSYVMEVIGASEKEIKRDVPRVLEIVGLSDKLENLPAELSGGEKQRVAIARALIHRPKVILADEPTGNLDPYHTFEIIQLLLKINKMGTTVILSTHNKEIVNDLGRRVVTLEEGKVIRDEERGRFTI
jgi:cell division transport system ATP-binding protein